MLAARRVTPADLSVLFEHWYALEALRSSLYRLPAPDARPEAWLTACQSLVGFVTDTAPILGGLLYKQAEGWVHVEHLLVDIHTPQTQAVGRVLWQAALSAWQLTGVCCVQADARARLPVEEAFWRACGASKVERSYVVRLC